MTQHCAHGGRSVAERSGAKQFGRDLGAGGWDQGLGWCWGRGWAELSEVEQGYCPGMGGLQGQGFGPSGAKRSWGDIRGMWEL